MILALILAVFLFSAVPLFAQDKHSLEIFGGYNFGPAVVYVCGIPEGCPGLNVYENMNGGNMAFTGNVNSKLGIKMEIAGVGRIKDNEKYRYYSLMAGPQVNRRFEAFPGTMFGHALFGVKHRRWSYDPLSLSDSSNIFVMALGGGIDWGKGRIGVRLPQIDYFPKRELPYYKYRVSTGIVFRFQ